MDSTELKLRGNVRGSAATPDFWEKQLKTKVVLAQGFFKRHRSGDFLAIQWLRLHLPVLGCEF